MCLWEKPLDIAKIAYKKCVDNFKHLPKALLKLAVRKEVGNARLLATVPFV